MEWTGDWSDTSPLWTEEMQAEIEVIEASDDGMFWMSFEDLVKNFYSVNVCMVRHKVCVKIKNCLKYVTEHKILIYSYF
jgi:hypothetical protein